MTEDESTLERLPDAGVVAARHEVELAKAELEIRLRDVGQAGRLLWARVGRQARPILIGGAIAVGALLLIRALRPRARPRSEWQPPGRPSLLRAAVGSALGVMARTVATEFARRILTPTERMNDS
jgi:hypothetical protein